MKVVSDQNVVASQRLNYFLRGVPVSFSEMMGTSDSLLNPTWWLPRYKSAGEIDTQLRFGVPKATRVLGDYLQQISTHAKFSKA
jgi:hypothetical protein